MPAVCWSTKNVDNNHYLHVFSCPTSGWHICHFDKKKELRWNFSSIFQFALGPHEQQKHVVLIHSAVYDYAGIEQQQMQKQEEKQQAEVNATHLGTLSLLPPPLRSALAGKFVWGLPASLEI